MKINVDRTWIHKFKANGSPGFAVRSGQGINISLGRISVTLAGVLQPYLSSQIAYPRLHAFYSHSKILPPLQPILACLSFAIFRNTLLFSFSYFCFLLHPLFFPTDSLLILWD
ncbi:hypothetical protein MIDIC_310040 [Alphaproteobacteria bacterium]